MATLGDRQRELLSALLYEKAGLTIERLAGRLGITRTAVRQHLAALERDGFVARGGSQPSGGRPEHLYVLTAKGAEQFTRQYAWFADLLVDLLKRAMGGEAVRERLRALGTKTANSLRRREPDSGVPSAQRLSDLAETMRGMGYVAEQPANTPNDIVAHNCVFHQLAAAHPEICAFDLGLMSAYAGASVDHLECMARGDHVCRFRFAKPAHQDTEG